MHGAEVSIGNSALGGACILGHGRSTAEGRGPAQPGMGFSDIQRKGCSHLTSQSKFIQISEGQMALGNI